MSQTPDTVIAMSPYVQPPEAVASLARLGEDGFVGRADTLEQLEQVFRRCVFSREPAVVVLHGPEGIGRRSIVRQFRGLLQRGGARFRTVQAEPAGEGASYLTQVLQDWFEPELLSPQPVQAVVGSLRRMVPTHEVVEVAVAVADALGLNLGGEHAAVNAARRLLADPASRERFLIDVMQRLLQREAERQPLLLSLLRLDLADPESRAVLAGALAAVEGVPLLALSLQAAPALALEPGLGGTSRPTRASGEHPWALGAEVDLSGAAAPTGYVPEQTRIGLPPVAPEPTPTLDAAWRRRVVATLDIGPLSELEMETLVRRALTGVRAVPEELVTMLLTDLGGVPGRLEARLAALKAHGILERDPGGAWIVHMDRLLERSLPRDLDALARARLLALPEKHTAILQLAAVVGPRFEVPMLLALMRLTRREGEEPFAEDRTAHRLHQVLLDCQGRDVLAYEPSLSTPGAQVFSFTLERERLLLEAGVSEERRRTLHRFIAQRLEAADAPPEEVARHWEAGQAGRRAAIALLRAGIAHARQFRTLRAIDALEASTSRLDIDEGADLLDGLEALAQCYVLTGEFPKARAVAERLAQYAYAMDAIRHGVAALLALSTAERRAGDFQRAERRLDTALRLVERLDPGPEATRLRADVLDAFVVHRWQHGDPIRDALDYAEQSLTLRTDLGDKAGMARTLLSIGKIQYSRKRLDNARSCFDRAAAAAEDQGALDILADARNAQGALALMDNDLERARDLWGETLELSRQLGDRALRAMVLSNLGEVALRVGEADLAQELLQRSVELARSIGDHRTAAESLRHLALLALQAIELTQALDLADQGLDAARQSGTRLAIARALRNRAEVLSATLYQDSATPHETQARTHEADRCFQEAIALLHAMGDKVHMREALTSHRTFLAERGRTAEVAALDARLAAL